MNYQTESAKSQLSVLGALMIGYAVLGLALGAVAVFILLGVAWASGDGESFVILTSVASGVGLLFAIGSVPSLLAGIGLLRRKSWSRVITLVASAINLINFPFGTALGIYAIVLLSSPAVASVLNDDANDVHMTQPPSSQAPTAHPSASA